MTLQFTSWHLTWFHIWSTIYMNCYIYAILRTPWVIYSNVQMILFLVNDSHELAQVITRYDCLSTGWVCSMFEPTSISPNVTFAQPSIWIRANNDHIWLPGGCDWFRVMFNQNPTWHNFTFVGQLVMFGCPIHRHWITEIVEMFSILFTVIFEYYVIAPLHI